MKPLEWERNTLRRIAWANTHLLDRDWKRSADAKAMLQALRWGMLLSLAAPEWAHQVIREDVELHKLDGKAPGPIDETVAEWLAAMRKEWIERFPVAAFGGETESGPGQGEE